MIINPCFNCKNRTKPKYCEKTCKIWAEYKIFHNLEKQEIKEKIKYFTNRSFLK